MLKVIFIVFLIMIYPSKVFSQEIIDKKHLISDMLNAVNTSLTFQFNLKDYERINNQLVAGEELVKISTRPLKFYFALGEPNKGAEVIWVEGKNNGKAWVHPNSFPYLTLSLNPNGRFMKEGHHAMFDLNFHYLVDLIESVKLKLGSSFYDSVTDDGPVIFDAKQCEKVTIVFRTFQIIDYTVGNGETVSQIAKKIHVCDYMIQERNSNNSHLNILKTGQHISIPNNYFSKLLLYIDKKSKLPLMEMFYDDIGLFEKYEFYSLKVNVAFTDNDFSISNPNYHF